MKSRAVRFDCSVRGLAAGTLRLLWNVRSLLARGGLASRFLFERGVSRAYHASVVYVGGFPQIGVSILLGQTTDSLCVAPPHFPHGAVVHLTWNRTALHMRGLFLFRVGRLLRNEGEFRLERQ